MSHILLIEEFLLSFSGVQTLSTVTDFNFNVISSRKDSPCQKGEELWSGVGCLQRKVDK